ncbi:hypothetical protein MuYL_1571 [Mucilaginibacter xinganensis]|uniref:Uncharacterized protein n=1 Tax=Mucilaginibacter xinganensis TaxID=1234841 RepID=A0A223NU94_9SPHI|nr:hypothetical protein MuYL_1571 [Mucilaginibacter xinganensis]
MISVFLVSGGKTGISAQNKSSVKNSGNNFILATGSYNHGSVFSSLI